MKEIRLDNSHFPPNVNLTTHLTTTQNSFIHSHDFFEIFYVLSGSISHTCKNETRLLNTGDMVVLRGLNIDTHNFKSMGDCVHRDIMITDKLFVKVCNNIKNNFYHDILYSTKPLYIKLNSVQMNYAEFLLKKINNIPIEQWDNKESLIYCCTVTLLSFVFQNYNFEQQLPFCLRELLERFSKFEFIKGGVTSIIESIDYNHIYLCRVFKKHMGMTMTDYLNSIRLNYAENYLRNSNLSITQICMELGFASISYFEKLFKNQYGTTPAKLRNRYRNNK